MCVYTLMQEIKCSSWVYFANTVTIEDGGVGNIAWKISSKYYIIFYWEKSTTNKSSRTQESDKQD